VRIAFYPSFRALEHVRASGLVSIARDVHDAMQAAGHEVLIPLHQSMEWIYLHPRLWPNTVREAWRADRSLRQATPDCWLTYHTYYRGPDIIGPVLTRKHHIPYFILAASYATKYRKRFKTWTGFHLNRRALQQADMVFVNKLRDMHNLSRLLPPDRITYIHPGIRTPSFPLVPGLRERMRAELGLNGKRVVVTAAMMRPGVKEEGIAFVIEACANVRHDAPDLHLLILGDGPGRQRLEIRAQRLLPDAHTFAGRIPPNEMHAFYQAGDIFAYPGINESLGMVYLEAQCCGLPVVATSHDGAPEVVSNGETGIIVPPFSVAEFADALSTLLNTPELRSRFSRQARDRILRDHDMHTNYQQMFALMEAVCSRRQS
jgi:glycosyltransferase involved in cell wall biosynthesis